uniref:Solute carrier family 13 member 2 n=1 Tax=Denticeps clupeoides TaxID=299321 RepID=A0AAY4D9Y8_9TELE
MGSCLKWLWNHRNYWIIFLTPLILLPLPVIYNSPEAKCGYAILLMSSYWSTECLPLAVTGLLPVILFPAMGVMHPNEVCMQYLKDATMLYIGGLFVAIAVEHWNLHKRIALRVLLLVGVKPSLLMIGFMSTTAFLSMWISNTAAAAMMLPITHAVLHQLSTVEAKANETDLQIGLDNKGFDMGERKESRNVAMGLCVCYSASIGGTATLTGTAPNLILKGQVDEYVLFPGNGDVLNFASWFGFAFPNMLLMLCVCWFWLHFMYLGFNFKTSFGCGTTADSEEEAYQAMKDEYRKLGRMRFAEGCVLGLFVMLVLLWFTREPGFMPGWASVLFDGTVSIVIAVLFFVIPSEIPKCLCLRQGADKRLKAPPPLLNWKVVQEKTPWSILLLMGGGFALAHGSETSGLSLWLGHSLEPLKNIPAFAISLILCLLMATFTECSSNVATTSLFLPILATAIELNPLYIMLPCTLCVSLAFMLPVATPPNAIAFSYGNLTVLDMVRDSAYMTVSHHKCSSPPVFHSYLMLCRPRLASCSTFLSLHTVLCRFQAELKQITFFL